MVDGSGVDLLSSPSGSLILSVLSEKKEPSAALTTSGKTFYCKNPEAAGHPADVSPVPINIQPPDEGKYWPTWVRWPDWPELWENSTDLLDLKIAFIVDPEKAAQSAQLKSLTGTLLKRWGVGKGQQEAGKPQDEPPKGDPLGEAIPKACGRSSGPPKGCGRSSGPPMSCPGGVTTRNPKWC